MNNDTLHIRPAEPRDHVDVLACIVDMQEAERLIDSRLRPGSAMAEEYLAMLERRLEMWRGEILVGEVDGEVVGFAAVYVAVPFEEADEPPGTYALLSDLSVREGHRRRGYGRLLIEHALAVARSAGASELQIGVLHGNSDAQRLYERSGFSPYLHLLTRKL